MPGSYRLLGRLDREKAHCFHGWSRAHAKRWACGVGWRWREAPRRHTAPHPCPSGVHRRSGRMKGKVRENEVAVWLHELKPWEDFVTITFRGRPARLERARRLIDRTLAPHRCAGLSYFMAYESNPSGDGGYHAHGVLHGLKVERRQLWRELFTNTGRTQITPIRSKGDVVSYCAKYCTKRIAWWDLRLYRQGST